RLRAQPVLAVALRDRARARALRCARLRARRLVRTRRGPRPRRYGLGVGWSLSRLHFTQSCHQWSWPTRSRRESGTAPDPPPMQKSRFSTRFGFWSRDSLESLGSTHSRWTFERI